MRIDGGRTRMRVAWLGLGAMGVRMARRLVAAGHEMTVWNRTAGRTDGLDATVAATPAAAVRDAEVVLLMLADPAALAEVTEAADGLIGAVVPGTTVVDLSTVGPAAVARLRAALPESVPLLDAPVMGSLAEAETGSLRLLTGGPTTAVAELEPLLSSLGEVVHLGPSGTGAAAKLVANFVLLGTLGVQGEAVALADGLGLQREVAWRILAQSPLAEQAEKRRPRMESGEFPARFALALARKDADLVVSMARATDTDLRLALALQRWLADAEAAGLGAQDYVAMLSHIIAPAGSGQAESPPAVELQ